MYLVTVLIIVAIFGIAILYSLLSQLKDKIEKAQDEVRNLFWKRRHLLPLYIELTRTSVKPELIAKLIELRTQATSPSLTLADELGFEATISHLVQEIHLEKEASSASDTSYLAVKTELAQATEAIRAHIGIHNFLVAEWCNRISKVWYRLVSFAFPKGLSSPLKNV